MQSRSPRKRNFGVMVIDVGANRADVIDILKHLVADPDDVHNDVHDDESWRLCVGGDLTMDEAEEITADLDRAGATVEIIRADRPIPPPELALAFLSLEKQGLIERRKDADGKLIRRNGKIVWYPTNA